MYLFKTFIGVMLTVILVSCSGDEEKNVNTGKIDTMTRDIGQEAASMIQTPLDKAQAAADIESQRVREMEEGNSR